MSKQCKEGSLKVAPRDALISANSELLKALCVISLVLSAPRNRLGRLDIAIASDEIRAAREELRLLAVAYEVPGCSDILEQCAKVSSAAIAKVTK